MLKRKFNPPSLHKPTASATPAAGPKWANEDEKEAAKRQLVKHIYGDKEQEEKENLVEPADSKPVLKKQKLFAAPVSASHQPLRPAQQQQGTRLTTAQQPVAAEGHAAVGGDAPKVFSVLYTKREKWKASLPGFSSNTRDHTDACKEGSSGLIKSHGRTETGPSEVNQSSNCFEPCCLLNAKLWAATLPDLVCHVQKKSDKGFQDGVIELRADGGCTLHDMVSDPTCQQEMPTTVQLAPVRG